MRTLIVLALIGFARVAVAADSLKVTPAVRYALALNVGSLIGKQQATSAMGITNWFTWHRLISAHAGLGVSWENYEGWQTVPFSFHLRYDIGKRKKNPWFLYGGYGQAWARLVPDYRPYNFQADHGGRGYSYGIGKSLRYERVEVRWQLGQQVQRVAWEEAYEVQNWFSSASTDPYTNRTFVNMTLRRVAFSMSVSWR